MASEAEVRFTVLVEIKAPGAKLLADTSHRNGAYAPSKELTEAVSQVQVNAHQWEVEGSRTDANRERLTADGIYTIAPRGVLVIGDTTELDTADKRRSFELYRQNVRCPEIITFDELLERARYIVGRTPQVAQQNVETEHPTNSTAARLDEDDRSADWAQTPSQFDPDDHLNQG